jgi:hypothetical protein
MTSRLVRIGVVLALIVPGMAGAQSAPVALFDGKTLSGWSHFLVDPAVAMSDVWSVKDGAIVCKGEPLGYLLTKAEYTNFTLTVEWRYPVGAAARLGKTPNSGVFVRLDGNPKPQGVPRTYEVQLQVGHAGDVMGFWGMPLDGDATRRREAKASPRLGDMVGFSRSGGTEKPEGEWNTFEITVNGGTITVRLNGLLVNQVSGAAAIPGHIGLQSEGGEVHFRRVELTPLEK